MRTPLTIIFLLVSLHALGQNIRIMGKIVDEETREPLPLAVVYVANTSMGSTTDINGQYNLINVPPGKFDLVVTILGYETEIRNMSFQSGREYTIDFLMTPKSYVLTELEVKEKQDKKWLRQLNRFKKEFLGESGNAQDCEILNPWVLDFKSNIGKGEFLAEASDPIEILNISLGYKLYFHLEYFKIEGDLIYYYGYPRFVYLNPQDYPESVNWNLNRQLTYSGSIRNFMNALLQDRLTENGFNLYQLSISASVFDMQTGQKKSSNTLDARSIDPTSIFWENGIDGNYTVKSNNDLRVIIKRKIKTPAGVWREMVEESRLHFIRGVLCSPHGYVYTPMEFEVYGFWAQERVADMLPFEYGL